MTEPGTITRLTKDQVHEFIRTYGLEAFFLRLSNNSQTLGLLSQVYTDYRTRQTSAEQTTTFNAFRDALPKLLDIIEAKEIRVVHGAFNSSAAFTAVSQSAALAAIPAVLLQLDDAIRRVALEGIRSEIAIANVAKVQGWEKDGFGAHVY
jgi:hypothetical protein